MHASLDDLDLSGGEEPLGVKDLLAQGPVEALVVAVFPRRSRIDLYGLDADFYEPFLKGGSNKLMPS